MSEVDEVHFPAAHAGAKPIIGHIAHEVYGFQRVHALDVDGQAILDGDILLGDTAHMHRIETMAAKHGIDHHSPIPMLRAEPPAAKHSVDYHYPAGYLPHELSRSLHLARAWPDRTFCWKIARALDSETRAKIEGAISWWTNTGLFKDMERVGSNKKKKNWVFFRSGANRSSLGMQGGRQFIFISQGSGIATIAHEIGHALGLPHTVRRRDAASYVRINFGDLPDDKRKQFETLVEPLKVGYYDYGSLMHYGRKENYTEEMKTVIEPFDKSVEIGQTSGVSIGDINNATACYRVAVSKIVVKMATLGDNTGDIFLGVGGREFRLDVTWNDGGRFGDGKVIVSPEPAMVVSEVVARPVYLRIEAGNNNNWYVGQFWIEVMTEELPPIVYSIVDPGQHDGRGLYLSEGSGWRLFLSRESPPKTEYIYIPPIRDIKSINCKIKTGAVGTKAKVYLALAGREFRLQPRDGTAFKGNKTDSFHLASDSTNVSNSSINELKFNVALTQADFQHFPMYLYTDGSDDWMLGAGSSIEVLLDGQTEAVKLEPVAQNILLGRACGTHCYLRYQEISRPERTSPHIRQIKVTVYSSDTQAAGLDNEVYLGLAGREFNLKALPGGSANEFILGHEANVVEKEHNDPRSPRLSQLDLDTYPAYIRTEGDDGPTLESVQLAITFEGQCGDQLFVETRNFTDASGAEKSWTERKLVFSDEGGKNPPRTVHYKSIFEKIKLDNENGMICSLERLLSPGTMV